LYNPSVGIYLPGSADDHEHDTVYIEPSSSSPGPGSDGYFEMEEEVGKRFYPMVPVPHVPKINGEIPSVDEATMDHERLTERTRLLAYNDIFYSIPFSCKLCPAGVQIFICHSLG
jgi:hypothetical protein